MKTKYEFRIVVRGGYYIVQEQTTNYNYGERLGDFGWCDAYRECELQGYFRPSYHTLEGAKSAIRDFQVGLSQTEDEVVWTEDN